MYLSAKNVEVFSGIVESIYDTVVNDALWPSILERSCAFVEGVAGNIFWQEFSGRQVETFHSWGLDSSAIDSYENRYVPMNPLYPAANFLEPGVVYAGHDLMPMEEFRETEFFKHWIAPQGLLDAAFFNIQRYRENSANFTIIRSEKQGLVDDGVRYRLGLLAPHIQRAVLIGREIDREKLHSISLEATLGSISSAVFIIAEHGKLEWANTAAEALLSAGDLVSRENGELKLSNVGANRTFYNSLAAVTAGDNAPLGRKPTSVIIPHRHGATWLGTLMPLQTNTLRRRFFDLAGSSPIAAFFVRKAELHAASAIEIVTKAYKLTPSEVRVLQQAIEGSTVERIARVLGISANTVKKHLSSLYGKFGISRRQGLVEIVAAHGGPVTTAEV